MAIQLNERDYLIFKLLEEHQVLLEKHLSWFLAPEDKPILIRDRLRKLFYLDYLLCQRHESKLSWWTTPTKPLVYMLAPLARTISGAKQEELDFSNNDWQRKHLEIANVRMIFLIAQKEGLLENFQWTTAQDKNSFFNAFISCTLRDNQYNIGLITHPEIDTILIDKLDKELSNPNLSHIMLISRDQSHQQALQTASTQLASHVNGGKLILATHQDLYKSGLDKAVFKPSGNTWHHNYPKMQAAS